MDQAIRIAIIDQGVDRSNTPLRNCPLEEVLISDGTPIGDQYRHLGHGTTIAGIIHNKVPDMPLVSIKLAANHPADVGLLAKALNYCANRVDIRVINISMGLLARHPPKALFQSCWSCFQRGKVIVATVHPHPYKRCFPAAFPFVYGVDSGLNQNSDDFYYMGEGYVNILAKGAFMRVFDTDLSRKLGNGSSYAAAFFSAQVGLAFLKKKISTSAELRVYLREQSRPVLPLYYRRQEAVGTEAGIKELMEKPELPERTPQLPTDGYLLFPGNRPAIGQLIRGRSFMAVRQVMAMYYPYTGIPESTGGDLRFIPGLLSPKLFQHVRTLVLDSFMEEASLVSIVFGYDLVRLALTHQADFIYWNDQVHEMLLHMIRQADQPYTGSLYALHRMSRDEVFRVSNFTTFPMPAAKVLAVVGAGPEARSLETQIAIKALLREYGFSVKHISTLPQGLLLGADHFFALENTTQQKLAFENVCKSMQHRSHLDYLVTGAELCEAAGTNSHMLSVVAWLQEIQSMKNSHLVIGVAAETRPPDLEKLMALIRATDIEQPQFFALLNRPAPETGIWLEKNSDIPSFRLDTPEDIARVMDLFQKPGTVMMHARAEETEKK